MRIPNHIGVIPDGNRRWAVQRSMAKEQGYEKGLDPGLQLYRLCAETGVKELTFYGFTQDNTKRPVIQRKAFTKACIDAVKMLSAENAELLVVGNTESPMFPEELLPYTKGRVNFGKGGIRVNFLVNYGWQWDLSRAFQAEEKDIHRAIHSAGVSRIDLIIRWGGRRRLSGFLPVQSIYADCYIIDELWPDFHPDQFFDALKWYSEQDITLGG